MTKFLYTVEELIEAECFTLEEYQNAYNETKDAETKPWKIFEAIGETKDVKFETFFEKANKYFNKSAEKQ